MSYNTSHFDGDFQAGIAEGRRQRDAELLKQFDGYITQGEGFLGSVDDPFYIAALHLETLGFEMAHALMPCGHSRGDFRDANYVSGKSETYTASEKCVGCASIAKVLAELTEPQREFNKWAAKDLETTEAEIVRLLGAKWARSNPADAATVVHHMLRAWNGAVASLQDAQGDTCQHDPKHALRFLVDAKFEYTGIDEAPMHQAEPAHCLACAAVRKAATRAADMTADAYEEAIYEDTGKNIGRLDLAPIIERAVKGDK